MLLERRLVQILYHYNIFKGVISRDDFVLNIINIKWPRINYYFYCKGDVFKRKVEYAIDDCLNYKFIVISAGEIKVTEKGRDYLKFFGFLEEFLKRRKRTVVNSLSFLLGVLAAYLINYFLY